MVEYKRKSRCGVDGCKSTLFTVESGRWFCKNGHMREGDVEMEADDDGFGQIGARATRGSTTEPTVRPREKVLKGRKGFELYLRCLQKVLQRHVWWLTHEKGYPAELETVVRDLWALRLQLVANALPEKTGSQATSRATSPASSRADIESSQESSSNAYSSDSDGYSVSSTRRGRRRTRKVPKARHWPKLIETIVLCYMGMLMLRCTVSLGDIHRWVESGDLVYVRAIRVLPAEMKQALDAEYWKAFDPQSKLVRGKLYSAVNRGIARLHETFGITFPPINKELLLTAYINELGLPLEIYAAVKHLATQLFFTFEWPAFGNTKLAAAWPEMRLMALVVIATKLCHGLDGKNRTPRVPSEPAATNLSPEAWEHFLRTGNRGRHGLLADDHSSTQHKLEIDTTPADVFDMSPDQLDVYMDWYEATWCSPDDEEYATKTPQGILSIFPTTREAGQPAGEAGEPAPDLVEAEQGLLERIRDLHVETLTSDAVPDEQEGMWRPGEYYLLTRPEDTMPVQLALLMQAAADLIAVDRSVLRRAVHSIEVQLRKRALQERAERKKQEAAATQEMDTEA